MSRTRSQQRPDDSRFGGWRLALPALIAILITMSLGAWQLQRASEKRRLAEQAERAAALPARTVVARQDALEIATGDRIALEGRFLADRTIFLDNRTQAGVAGFHVFTPLLLADGSAVLVLRGWIAGDRRERDRVPAPATPRDHVRVEGTAALALEQAYRLGEPVPPGPSDRIWQAVTIAGYRAWSGLDLLSFALRQTADSGDGLVRAWPRVGDRVARHEGYAIQWFTMALAIAAIWYFAARRRGASDAG